MMRESSRRDWLIACDESSIDSGKHYGFGCLWMPYDRRGDFFQLWSDLLRSTGLGHECKWNEVGPGPRVRFALAAVELFFSTPWLVFHVFHCLVVRRSSVEMKHHGGNRDLALRKHFTMFLVNKIKRAAMRPGGKHRTFRVWVDPLPSRYKKADEAVEAISMRMVAKAIRDDIDAAAPEIRVSTRDSKLTPAIQLCDLLLGAVVSAWNGKSTRSEKAQVMAAIALHLDWPDLLADTPPTHRKFNVWYFHDPINERERSVETRRTLVG